MIMWTPMNMRSTLKHGNNNNNYDGDDTNIGLSKLSMQQVLLTCT